MLGEPAPEPNAVKITGGLAVARAVPSAQSTSMYKLPGQSGPCNEYITASDGEQLTGNIGNGSTKSMSLLCAKVVDNAPNLVGVPALGAPVNSGWNWEASAADIPRKFRRASAIRSVNHISDVDREL